MPEVRDQGGGAMFESSSEDGDDTTMSMLKPLEKTDDQAKSHNSHKKLSYDDLKAAEDTADDKVKSKSKKDSAKKVDKAVTKSKKNGAGDNALNLQCDVCQKSFPRNFDLNRHKRTHSAEKPHKCDICGKMFSQKAHLKKHLGTHDSSKVIVEKPSSYKCDQCDKEFPLKFNLQRHEKTHSAEREFNCEICEKAFTQMSHLKKHMVKHSADTSSGESETGETEVS